MELIVGNWLRREAHPAIAPVRAISPSPETRGVCQLITASQASLPLAIAGLCDTIVIGKMPG